MLTTALVLVMRRFGSDMGHIEGCIDDVVKAVTNTHAEKLTPLNPFFPVSGVLLFVSPCDDFQKLVIILRVLSWVSGIR